MSTIFEFIYENIESLQRLEVKDREIKVDNSSQKILTFRDGMYTMKFLRYDSDSDKYIYRYSKLKYLKIAPDIEVNGILQNNLSLSYQGYLNNLLKLNQKEIQTIEVRNDIDNFSYVRKTLKISAEKLNEVITSAKRINKKGSEHKGIIERYLTNQEVAKIFNEKIIARTLIRKGEFKFIIDRLNLKNKKTEKDFAKYLGKPDLVSLEELCDFLVKKEVFSQAFLNKLDDYFIKEKLTNIVSLGNEIISIGKDDLTTQKAIDVIEKISPDDPISQMETVWQRYFEKYLLHLIFSYRKIYSKVKFLVDGDKKYPDFIGINHYRGVDIIEIKTHIKNALVFDRSHDNYAFSSELSKAIIQTTNYMDAIILQKFNEEENDDALLESILKENIIRPRGIIIISSENHLVSGYKRMNEEQRSKVDRDFTKLRNSLANIEIITFSEILNTAKNYSENIMNE